MAKFRPIFGNSLVFTNTENCCTPRPYCIQTFKSDWVYQQFIQEPCGANLTDCPFYQDEDVFYQSDFPHVGNGLLPTGWTNDGNGDVDGGILKFMVDAQVTTDLTLTTGTSYRLNLKYKCSNASLFIIETGSSGNIFNQGNVAGVFEGEVSVEFVAEGTGVIYFLSNTIDGYTFVYDFEITEVSSCYVKSDCSGFVEEFDSMSLPAGWSSVGPTAPTFTGTAMEMVTATPSAECIIDTGVTFIAGRTYRLSFDYNLISGILIFYEYITATTSDGPAIFYSLTDATGPTGTADFLFEAKGTGPLRFKATQPDTLLGFDIYVGFVEVQCATDWTKSGDGVVCLGDNPSPYYYDGTPIDAGLFQVALTILNYISGSITITAGDAVSDPVFGNGTHKVFLKSTTTGTVTITPTSDFVGCLSGGLETMKMADTFVVQLLNEDGSFLADLAGYVTTFEDYVTLKFRWSDLPLSDSDLGCKTITWNENCAELELFNLECPGTSEYTVTKGTNDLVFCDGIRYNYLQVQTNPEVQGDILVTKTDGFFLTKGVRYKITLPTLETDYGSVNIGYDFGGDSGTIADSNDSPHDVVFFVTPSEDTNSISISLTATGYDPGFFGDQCFVAFGPIKISIAEIDKDYTTNCLKFLTTEEETTCATKLIKGFSDTNNGGFNFIESEFLLQARLKCSLGRSSYKEDANIGIDSGGNALYPYGSTQKSRQLTFDLLPNYLHDFISVVKRMEHFLVDGTEMVSLDTDYQPEWTSDDEALPAQSRFDVIKKEKNTTFRYNC